MLVTSFHGFSGYENFVQTYNLHANDSNNYCTCINTMRHISYTIYIHIVCKNNEVERA